MAKRIVRLLPCLLTCLFLLGSLVTFAGALTPSGAPDYSKWDVPEVLNREDLTEQFPDGSFRLDLTTIRIVGIKQATYMLIWSREPLDETVQRDVVAAFRENDPSNYTDIAFYHGTGVFEKPSFWNKGNSFGRYGITREGDTWYLTIGGAGSVSHFVFGFGTTSEPTTTTGEPTTTTGEPTTTTTVPDLEIIDDEETPLADLPQGSDPAGSPKTGNTALPWLFIGAAAISLTVAVLINRRPAQEA